ncbi:hypothetical protein M3J09_012684 [Ascochyta lentis]
MRGGWFATVVAVEKPRSRRVEVLDLSSCMVACSGVSASFY